MYIVVDVSNLVLSSVCCVSSVYLLIVASGRLVSYNGGVKIAITYDVLIANNSDYAILARILSCGGHLYLSGLFRASRGEFCDYLE